MSNINFATLLITQTVVVHQTLTVHNKWTYGPRTADGGAEVQLIHNFDIASVTERATGKHAFEYLFRCLAQQLDVHIGQCSLSTNLQSICLLPCRRLTSMFRPVRHVLHVNTGCWADCGHVHATNRLCLACKCLDCVEDEQHIVFPSCYAQCTAIPDHRFWTSCSSVVLLQTFIIWSLCESSACNNFLRESFAFMKQFLDCMRSLKWSVGSQLPSQDTQDIDCSDCRWVVAAGRCKVIL